MLSVLLVDSTQSFAGRGQPPPGVGVEGLVPGCPGRRQSWIDGGKKELRGSFLSLG